MNNAVTRAYYGSPRDLRVGFPDRIRDVGGHLANQFQISQDRIVSS